MNDRRMNYLMLFSLIICALLLSGCATAHRQITAKTAVLGQPFWSCNANNECAMVKNWEVPGRKPGTTAQLTLPGCALHTLATLGHVAWECRNEKATRGRWIWRSGKTPRMDLWTDKDSELSARYYGKPYLEVPPGWHWVCWNMPSERCYIDKDATK